MLRTRHMGSLLGSSSLRIAHVGWRNPILIGAAHAHRTNMARAASTSSSPINFSMDQAGVATDLYIHPKELPSWFTSPGVRWKALKRKVQVLGVNTWMAIKLRREIGRQRFQPLEWKETALLLYSRMNETFVSRDLVGLGRVVSRWVYGPLSARAQQLPKDYVYHWNLVRYTKKPRILSLIPLAMPNEPTRFVQAVYRIDSVQVLSKTKLGSKQVDRVERTVSDNVAFIFDTLKDPVEGRLIGSLFETPINMPMPDPMTAPTSRPEVLKAMTMRGDVFRNPPEYVAVREKGA